MAKTITDSTWTNRIMSTYATLGAVVDIALKFPDKKCLSLIKTVKQLFMYIVLCSDVAFIICLQSSEFLTTKLDEYVDAIPNDYNKQSDDASNKENWENAISTIIALGNAGVPSTIPSLQKAIKEKKLQSDGRVSAVYALRGAGFRTPDMVSCILNVPVKQHTG